MKTRLFKATEKGLLGVCVLSHGIVKVVEKIEETSFNKAVSVRAKRTGNTEKQLARLRKETKYYVKNCTPRSIRERYG